MVFLLYCVISRIQKKENVLFREHLSDHIDSKKKDIAIGLQPIVKTGVDYFEEYDMLNDISDLLCMVFLLYCVISRIQKIKKM